MYEILDKLGYLNFDKMLMDNYYHMGISETEAVFLNKLYYLNKKSNLLTINNLLLETNLSKKEIDNVLASLIKNKLIEIKHEEISGMISETYSVKPTLTLLEKTLKNRYNNKKIVSLIEESFRKTLSTNDLLIIKEFRYSYEEVRIAVIECLKRQVSEVKYLKKVLENNDK